MNWDDRELYESPYRYRMRSFGSTTVKAEDTKEKVTCLTCMKQAGLVIFEDFAQTDCCSSVNYLTEPRHTVLKPKADEAAA